MTDKPIYRMSEAGRCPCALSAIRQNYTPEARPAYLEIAAEEGKWHEDRIVRELQSEGYIVKNRQSEFSLACENFTLVGHIDGIIHNWGNGQEKGLNKILLEIKSMSQFEFDRWVKGNFKEFPTYADQLACYMKATGLNQALYIVKNRSSGYKDRRVLTDFSERVDTIVGKITAIEDYLARWIRAGARDGTYPADFDPNSIECRRCEFKYLCAPEPKELTEVEEEKLVTATHSWREGDFMIKRGQELVAKSKETFEQHTKATGINKWRFAELAINLIHVKETLGYPKNKLLQIFTEEQLEPASVIKLPYEYVRIDDLRKEEQNETK